jgi:GNAT superfamily N-acetyltransferase
MMNQSNIEFTESRWTIKSAQESDLNDLIEMRLALQRHLEERNSNVWRMSSECHERLNEQIIQNLDDRDTCTLVAIHVPQCNGRTEDSNCKIIAMATGSISFHRYRIPSTIACIENVFVKEEFRRIGIGTALVSKLCQFFASRYVNDISVKYVIGNEEAECFWEKIGFQPRIITAGSNLHDLRSKGL